MRYGLLVLACFLTLAAAPASGQQRPTFSIDFQGPTIGVLDGCGVGAPISEGDILTTTPPGPLGPNAAAFGPLPPPCIMVGAAGPGTRAPAPGLTIIASPPFHELDALSYGRDVGDQLYFSVDEFALGVPTLAPDVFSEGIVGSLEASADVFVYSGAAVSTPPGPPLGNSDWNDGNGLAPPCPSFAATAWPTSKPTGRWTPAPRSSRSPPCRRSTPRPLSSRSSLPAGSNRAPRFYQFESCRAPSV